MRKLLKAILFISLTAITFSGCSFNIKHYEDKIYSEKIFNDYKEKSDDVNSSSLTREKAIEKAILLFDKGMGIKIDRSSVSESVKLYRSSSNDSFKWQIFWHKKSTNTSYYCEIDSINGEILNISFSPNEKPYNYVITKDKQQESKLIEIVMPLLSILNINADDFTINIEQDKKSGVDSQYMILYFIKKDSNTPAFNICVNISNNKIAYYSKINIGSY